jgi:hypothetical protein
MSKVIQVFMDADLRCGHDGLADIAKKEKINVTKLEHGEFVMFINVERNKLKLYTANNIVAYLRLPQGKIEMRTLGMIPAAFAQTGRISYDEHLKEVLQERLGKHKLQLVDQKAG